LRTDVEFVVTEFGARRIRHLPLRQRAEALIEISHPDYRDRLLDEWHELAANQ
jgi:4-hydroxybutyrate CoA-transferase